MALKLIENFPDPAISFEKIHEIHIRANPVQMMKYRLSIKLYKIHNANLENDIWIDMNFQQNFNERNTLVQIYVTESSPNWSLWADCFACWGMLDFVEDCESVGSLHSLSNWFNNGMLWHQKDREL